MNKYSFIAVGFVLGLAPGLLINISDSDCPKPHQANSQVPIKACEDIVVSSTSNNEIDVGDISGIKWYEPNKVVPKKKQEEKEKSVQDVINLSVFKTAKKITEHSDENELKSIIKSFTNFSNDDIDSVGDVRAFTKRLLEIASNGVVETAQDNTFPENVEFHSGDDEARGTFNPNEKIYATVNTSQYQSDEIFVKWYKKDDPQIYLFKKYKIDPNKEENFVWYQKKEGLPTGEYSVEFYSTDSELSPIGGGSFYVSE